MSSPSIAAVAGNDIRLDTAGNLTNTGQPAGWLSSPPVWLFGPVVAMIGVIALSFAGRQALSLLVGVYAGLVLLTKIRPCAFGGLPLTFTHS